MDFLKAALSHWKTTTAGLSAALLIIANSYSSGMTWKTWGIAAAMALLGLGAGDAKPPVKP